MGGEKASQHPPGTRKSFRFGRACVLAVSVMSSRKEQVRRGGCIWREVVSFISWKYFIFGILVVVFPKAFPKRMFQDSFPREFSKHNVPRNPDRVSQDSFPRKIPKKCSRHFPKMVLQESAPREFSKIALQDWFPRESSKRVCQESSPRDFAERVTKSVSQESFPR